ncbi:MAG: hypothetical protein JEZ09_08765 [Salinivirgaceae bacterium]|nr:hypothetical protein [Salinivirgaceae bacterium]
MKKLKIYIDVNYPKRLVDILIQIHNLQKEKQYELVSGSNYEIDSPELKNAIFLLVDNRNRGVEITTLKHYEDGCRVIACKTGGNDKLDRFEFSMTVLRVWPYIVEKTKEENAPFLYTFRYGGRKLTRVKKAI